MVIAKWSRIFYFYFLSFLPLYQEAWSAHLLPDDKSTETKTIKNIFLWYQFQRDVISFFEVENDVHIHKILIEESLS